METITYDDFKKLEMRIGTIKFVEPMEGADKLLRCEIDFGTLPPMSHEGTLDNELVEDREVEYPFDKPEYVGRDMRQIVSGIREFFPEYKNLEGKQALYVVNLEPREIRGVMSHGMLMAVDGMDGSPVFLTPEHPVDPGSKVR